MVLMYDISNRETFDALGWVPILFPLDSGSLIGIDLLRTWFNELDTFASQSVVKYIVGNKIDKVSGFPSMNSCWQCVVNVCLPGIRTHSHYIRSIRLRSFQRMSLQGSFGKKE